MTGFTFVGRAAGGSQQHTQYKKDQIHPQDNRAGPNAVNQSWTVSSNGLLKHTHTHTHTLLVVKVQSLEGGCYSTLGVCYLYLSADFSFVLFTVLYDLNISKNTSSQAFQSDSST